MSNAYSPTGYWAHFVHTDEYVESGGGRVSSLPVLLVDGAPVVINPLGLVTPLRDAFPPELVKATFVNPSPTFAGV